MTFRLPDAALEQDIAIVGRKGATVEPTALDFAYAAGFFDGEGAITIAQGARPDCRHPIYNMRVIVGQNDPAPLVWLRDRWGGSIITRAPHGTRKRHYTWCCFARQASKFLSDLLPHLMVKRERATLAIEFQGLRGAPGVNMGADMRARAADCRERMLTLNAYPRHRKAA